MAPHSLWSKVPHYKGNRVTFGTQPRPNGRTERETERGQRRQYLSNLVKYVGILQIMTSYFQVK